MLELGAFSLTDLLVRAICFTGAQIAIDSIIAGEEPDQRYVANLNTSREYLGEAILGAGVVSNQDSGGVSLSKMQKCLTMYQIFREVLEKLPKENGFHLEPPAAVLPMLKALEKVLEERELERLPDASKVFHALSEWCSTTEHNQQLTSQHLGRVF